MGHRSTVRRGWLALAMMLAASVPNPLEPAGAFARASRGRDGARLRRRSRAPGGTALAIAGPCARRAIAGGRRQRQPAAGYYFGATGGGLWKTTDGGLTWRAVSDRFFKSSSVGAVAVSDSNPDVVYVGMGETELRGNVLQGDGLYKSVDARQDLDARRAREDARPCRASAFTRPIPTSPTSPRSATPTARTLIAGSSRPPTAARPGRRRCSATTRPARSISPWTRKTRRCCTPACGKCSARPHSLSSGGPGSGLFKTTDGGQHWTELTRNPGLPKPLWGKVGVAVSPADGSRVYAIIEAADGGVFRSDDAGATWTLANDDRRLRQRAFYYSRIYADPEAKDTVYVLNTGVYRSTDAGKSLRTDPRPARRQPRLVDRRQRSQADDQRQRRQRQRLDQRR